MRVLAIGGGGMMGSRCAAELVASDQVSKVTIVDLSAEKAKRRLTRMGVTQKVAFEEGNASDYSRVLQLAREHDVIVNTAGPFYQTAQVVVKAAIEAKVNYVDICDDYDATKATFELDSQAKKAGVTVITGLGWDPGTVNVLARYAAEKLDRVEEIQIAWFGTLAAPAGYAVGLHMFHVLSGDVPQFVDGELKYLPARTGTVLCEFAPPGERMEVYYIGHPEPLTLPLYFPGVKRVEIRGGMGPTWVNQVFGDWIEFGLASDQPVQVEGGVVKPRDVLMATRRLFPIKRDIGEPMFGFRVDVKGRQGKGERSYSYLYTSTTTEMSAETGVPAAIGALMLGAGKIKAKGVVAPEGCIDPVPYFKELDKRNLFNYIEVAKGKLEV